MDYESTTFRVGWFREEYMKGNLELKPPWQRKPVWAARQKCALIETILLGLPVPEIYVQVVTSAAGKTTYAVVDGQQRIRTVLQFVGCDRDPSEQSFNKFALDKLSDQSDWQDSTFEELTGEEKKRFYGYSFAVRLLNTNSDDDVRDMFRRLNQYLMPLKPQELRNAMYAGPFITLATKLADDEYWAANKILTATSIRRMGDIEFVSELLIGVFHGPQGGSRKIVDDYYAQYEDCEDEFPEQRATTKLFKATLQVVQETLPNIADTRWGNKTDFYTLFVAIASLLRTGTFIKKQTRAFQQALDGFEQKVNRRLADESARVPKNAIAYVRAVEKGANDKKRRGDRHIALLEVIRPYFKS